MTKHRRIYLYTFFGVSLSIFIIGFVGINLSLNYIQEKYIELQLDVNKRQADQMAQIIQGQLKKGISKEDVRTQFQETITGTETDKGFLCMYDTKVGHLVCHPDSSAIGMQFDEDFIFRKVKQTDGRPISSYYEESKPIAGLFEQAGMRTDIVYSVPIEGTNWFINAHENIEAISAEIKMLRSRYIIGSIFLGILIAIAATITARRISRRYEKHIEEKNKRLDKSYRELKILHDQVNVQKHEIESQKEFVEKQNREISLQNKEITDSINYAKRIQSAVLPSIDSLKNSFPESFIYFKPKDIVSGDFFWFTKVDQYEIVVAADCTGHGVPGAFMSMLGVTMLNEIVNKRKILQADLILNELRTQIKSSISQNNGLSPNDGMDISLCIIEKETNQLRFAGAYNSLLILRQTEGKYKIQKVQADKMPIGKHPKDTEPFTNHQLQLQAKDRLYLFSDGYVSQFGGEKGQKFKSRRFHQLLLDVQSEKMDQQKRLVAERFESWMGHERQVDDILLMGIEVS